MPRAVRAGDEGDTGPAPAAELGRAPQEATRRGVTGWEPRVQKGAACAFPEGEGTPCHRHRDPWDNVDEALATFP